MDKIRYFDYAATTPLKDEVIKEMMPFFKKNFGNASSSYTLGRKSKKEIEKSRHKVAKAINASDSEIYFTSGGSESDNLAIKGIALANRSKGNHIITTKIEHPAVLHTCKNLETQGFSVTYLNVDKNGFISSEDLKRSITPKTILISIMFANNEIGTIEPIYEMGKIAKQHNVIFHTDSVQAIGNIEIDVKKMNIDALSLSAHKFYGPKGIGAVYIKSGIMFEKLQDGGHQEKDKRAGTESVAGIVGLGKAIELANRNINKYNKKLTTLREYYFTEIEKRISNVIINGDRNKRLPGNANVSFENINGSMLLSNLDDKGICASAGSACSTGSVKPSHVLEEINVPKNYIEGTLRVTFGEYNTKQDVDYLINSLEKIIPKLRLANDA